MTVTRWRLYRTCMRERARVTTIRLPARLIERLDAAAYERATNRSALIIRASLAWLKREENEEKQHEEGRLEAS